jgi:hypothetical protein
MRSMKWLFAAVLCLIPTTAYAQDVPDSQKPIEQVGDQTVVVPPHEVPSDGSLPKKESSPNELAPNPVEPAPGLPVAVESIPVAASGTVVLPALPPLSPVAISPDPKPYDAHRFMAGFGFDLGAPASVNLGFVMHPKLDWMSIELSFAYLIGPGGRLSVRLDPFAAAWHNLPIGLFIDPQVGFFARENMPVDANKIPSIGYDYFNAYLGLRFGKFNGFSWVFEGGPSFLHVNSDNFASVIGSSLPSGLTLSNPSANAWVVPTGQTGLQMVW